MLLLQKVFACTWCVENPPQWLAVSIFLLVTWASDGVATPLTRGQGPGFAPLPSITDTHEAGVA